MPYLEKMPGGSGYCGKRRKFHQIHIPPSYSPTCVPKLDLFCDLIMQPLRKGEAHSVKNDPWTVIQTHAHKLPCSRNNWKSNVGVLGCYLNRKNARLIRTAQSVTTV